MNEILNTLIQVGSGGLAGAIIVATVNWRIHKDKTEKPDRAYEVIKQITKRFEDGGQIIGFVSGHNANFRAATKLYQLATGELYATSFFENPVVHGERDFVRHFTRGGSLVTRITSDNVCDAVSAKKTRESMNSILKGSQLVVVDHSKLVTKVDGIFCELDDGSYVTFFSLKRILNMDDNRGIIVRGALAKWLFNYFKEVATGSSCL